MIQLTNVEKTYNLGKTNAYCALHEINLHVDQGAFIAITGKSGAGKSTLLHILGCIDSVTGGTYELFGENVSSLKDRKLSHIRNRFFGFVMQDFALIDHLSVRDNIMMPALLSKEKIVDLDKRIWTLAEQVGIESLLSKNVNQLSGGEKQRVAVARSLINAPSILIADEPTGNLDSTNSENLYQVFREIHRDGVSIIVVTHDSDLARKFDRQIVVSDGHIIEDCPRLK